MNETTDPMDINSPTEWFYVDAQRQQQGPLSTEELTAQVQNGLLPADTLVWKDGMSDWQPLQFIPGLLPAGMPTGPAPLPSQAAIMASDAEVDRSDIVYAGFLRRTAAFWLDSMVLGMLSYLVMIPAFFMAGLSEALDGTTPPEPGAGMIIVMLLSYALILVMNAVYFAWMHSRPAQATLGKMACGIKVTDENGDRISFKRGLGRYFGFILSSMTLYIGLIMAGFTDRKRALHDMLCNTLVVDKWAYTNRPDMQKRGLDTVTMVVLVIVVISLLFTMVMFAGMMALLFGAANGWPPN